MWPEVRIVKDHTQGISHAILEGASDSLDECQKILPSTTYCYDIESSLLFCMGVKLSLLHYGKNIDLGCVRTGC